MVFNRFDFAPDPFLNHTLNEHSHSPIVDYLHNNPIVPANARRGAVISAPQVQNTARLRLWQIAYALPPPETFRTVFIVLSRSQSVVARTKRPQLGVVVVLCGTPSALSLHMYTRTHLVHTLSRAAQHPSPIRSICACSLCARLRCDAHEVVTLWQQTCTHTVECQHARSQNMAKYLFHKCKVNTRCELLCGHANGRSIARSMRGFGSHRVRAEIETEHTHRH